MPRPCLMTKEGGRLVTSTGSNKSLDRSARGWFLNAPPAAHARPVSSVVRPSRGRREDECSDCQSTPRPDFLFVISPLCSRCGSFILLPVDLALLIMLPVLQCLPAALTRLCTSRQACLNKPRRADMLVPAYGWPPAVAMVEADSQPRDTRLLANSGDASKVKV